MAVKGGSQISSLLCEEKIVESRPITPPCRNVVRGAVSNGLVVLPPDSGNVHFNKEVATFAQTKRHGSADRIQKKLRSVERSNSAGGRLINEKNLEQCDDLGETRIREKVENQASLKNADARSKSNTEQKSNRSSVAVDGINDPLDKLHISEVLPIDMKAEFVSFLMEKNYDKALHLCEQMLAIDPGNETCVEFQNTIRQKMEQDESSEDDGEADASETDDDDDDDDNDEDDDDDESTTSKDTDSDDADDDDESDEEDEDESESSSDSDVELPSGPINILMGGLPLLGTPTQPDKES